MKRLIGFGVLLILAVTSILLAQDSSKAILRTGSGDRPLAIAHQNEQTFFAADEVVNAIGGTVGHDANGFKVTLGGTVAAFGSDSRFAVVRDDLIEMPAPPMVIEGRPYVTIQFFQGLLSKSANPFDVTWDATARILQVRPAPQNVAAVQISVANVQGISKIVLTLTAPVEYTILKEQGAYTVRFKTPIKAAIAEQTFDDPYVTKATVAGNDIRVQLTATDVVADAYRLEDPFRIVLDVRKAAAGSAPGSLPPLITSRPVTAPGIHTIVIDPGHGGKDVGASGPSGLMEKDATLALCRKLATAIGTRLGTRVILTREDDSVLSLDQRTALANQYKADLLLSVHMNAAVVKGAHGSETYFLSADASDALAQKAAQTENASTSSSQTAASTDLKLILWDLAQQDYLQESSRFAQSIQEEMNVLTGVQGRGVKQAPFKVLVGATMPAALVEVAFISNPEEEAKLQQDDFQNSVVDAITRAVQRYKTDYETRIGVIRPAANTSTAPVHKPEPAVPVGAPSRRTGT